MKLILVESPTKATTLKKFLGNKYQVMASYGHVRDLPKGKLGVDTEKEFEPSYVVPTKARKNLTALKKEAQKADGIILATDEDREGEAIAWHLAAALDVGAEHSKRIVFHEITKHAIQDALKNPRAIDMKLVNAQQARRILDRLVGYKLSPFLWKKVARGLSAGRVQSVAVRLVVDREREIEKFKPQEYFSVEALLTPAGTADKFSAHLHARDDKALGKLAVTSQKEADDILKALKGTTYTVSNVEEKELNKNPLAPFTTSTLQQAAGARFGYPAKRTMMLAQNLYERGFITYHRTDSLNLASSAIEEARALIEKEYGKAYLPEKPRHFRTRSKGAQEAHEAIRPSIPDGAHLTARHPDKVKLEGPQKKLYSLI